MDGQPLCRGPTRSASPGDHMIIHAAPGPLRVPPRGGEKCTSRLSGVGDAGITMEGGKRKREASHTPWEIFENDCPECHSRSLPDGTEDVRSTSLRFWETSLTKLALSTWRYRVERTESLPNVGQSCSPGRYSHSRDVIRTSRALLNIESKHGSVNPWLASYIEETICAKRYIWD